MVYIGAPRVPVGAAGTKHNVSRGKKSVGRAGRERGRKGRARGVLRGTTVPLPTRDWTRTRFRFKSCINEGGPGSRKQLESIIPSPASRNPPPLCSPSIQGWNRGLISATLSTALIRFAAREKRPRFSSPSPIYALLCKLCNKIQLRYTIYYFVPRFVLMLKI